MRPSVVSVLRDKKEPNEASQVTEVRVGLLVGACRVAEERHLQTRNAASGPFSRRRFFSLLEVRFRTWSHGTWHIVAATGEKLRRGPLLDSEKCFFPIAKYIHGHVYTSQTPN